MARSPTSSGQTACCALQRLNTTLNIVYMHNLPHGVHYFQVLRPNEDSGNGACPAQSGRKHWVNMAKYWIFNANSQGKPTISAHKREKD